MSSRGRGRNTIKDAQVQDGRLHGSNRQPITLIARAAYAASRISSNLKGTTKQFGWLQASATKVSSLSITSANPATIRICKGSGGHLRPQPARNLRRSTA